MFPLYGRLPFGFPKFYSHLCGKWQKKTTLLGQLPKPCVKLPKDGHYITPIHLGQKIGHNYVGAPLRRASGPTAAQEADLIACSFGGELVGLRIRLGRGSQLHQAIDVEAARDCWSCQGVYGALSQSVQIPPSRGFGSKDLGSMGFSSSLGWSHKDVPWKTPSKQEGPSLESSQSGAQHG